MTDPVTELSERALALPPEDRARLAEELLASLDDRGGRVLMPSGTWRFKSELRKLQLVPLH